MAGRAFEKEEDVFVVHPKAGAPPRARISVTLVNAGLEQPPANLVASVHGEAERGERFGERARAIADDDRGHAALFGHAQELATERGEIKLPVLVIVTDIVVGERKDGEVNRGGGKTAERGETIGGEDLVEGK